MSVPNFIQQLDRMKAIHEKKSQDYSTNNEAFSNFEQAAVIASWFNNPTAKVFATMIGIKLSRIANLLNKGGEPNNESLDDSFLDNDTYSVLFHCWYLQNFCQKQELPGGEYKGDKYQCRFCGVQFIGPPSILDNGVYKHYFCNVLHKEEYMNGNIQQNQLLGEMKSR
jgi:hypothetical protein